jgi:hypothetical protein
VGDSLVGDWPAALEVGAEEAVRLESVLSVPSVPSVPVGSLESPGAREVEEPLGLGVSDGGSSCVGGPACA